MQGMNLKRLKKIKGANGWILVLAKVIVYNKTTVHRS